MHGGFPAVRDVEEVRLMAVLQSYASMAVSKDVIERRNLANPQAMSLFASKALSYNGKELSLQKTRTL